MEKVSNQISLIPEKKKINYWIISTITLGISLILLILFILKQNFLVRSNSNMDQAILLDEESSKKNEPTASVEELERKDTLDFFISDYLDKYPKFKDEVKPESIKRVFPVPDKIELMQRQSWLIEYEREPQILAYYLLTPTLEKELLNVKSCVSQDENPPIELEDIQTNNIVDGYVILSGKKNSCYGGAGSGFVSIYNSRTGEKIKFQGDFKQPGSIWSGVSKTGNALGILRGIYGVNTPTIVVEYGDFAGNTRKFGELGAIAFFDLQIGKLKQLVEFK